MCCVFIVKVYSIIFDSNFEHFIISSMSQYKLLNQKEGFLVVNVLPHLNNSTPSVRCKLLFAVITLHVNLSELCDKSLLHFCLIIQFFLDSQLNLYTLWMRLSPYESCLQNFCPIQSFDLFQQKWKQFFAISLAGNPRRSHVSMAKPAKVDNPFFGNSDSDICFGDGASFTDVANGGKELYTAHWA